MQYYETKDKNNRNTTTIKQTAERKDITIETINTYAFTINATAKKTATKELLYLVASLRTLGVKHHH